MSRTAAPASRRSALRTEDGLDGPRDERDVAPERPVLDVVVVEAGPFGDRLQVSAPAVDLGPPGDPRIDTVSIHVPVNRLSELSDVVRSLRSRTDQGHVPADHVEQLWELVDAHAPQHSPGRRDAVVLRRDPGGGAGVVHEHRPELQDLDLTPVPPDAELTEQDRTRTREANRDGARDQERARKHEETRPGQDVERPLEHTSLAAKGGMGQRDHGDAPQVVGHRAFGESTQLEETRDEVEPYP